MFNHLLRYPCLIALFDEVPLRAHPTATASVPGQALMCALIEDLPGPLVAAPGTGVALREITQMGLVPIARAGDPYLCDATPLTCISQNFSDRRARTAQSDCPSLARKWRQ